MNTCLLGSTLLLWSAWLAAANCPYVWRDPVPTDLLLELVVPAGGAVWTLPAGAATARRRQLAQAGVFTVYWGDNTAVQRCSSAEPCTHTFASAGVFTSIIEGPVVGWAMTLAWREQQHSNVALRSVVQWGGLELDASSGYHFYGGTQLQSLPPLSALDTSQITSFQFSFSGLPVKCVDVSGLDPRSALVLTGAFANSPCLTFANVSAWDVSQARDVSLMFAGTTVTTIVGLESWNVSRVVNATGLFANATALQADLSRWALDSLQDATGMLAGAPLLARNLSGWAVTWTEQTCLPLVQSAQLENWQAPFAYQQWLPSVTPSASHLDDGFCDKVSLTNTKQNSYSHSERVPAGSYLSGSSCVDQNECQLNFGAGWPCKYDSCPLTTDGYNYGKACEICTNADYSTGTRYNCNAFVKLRIAYNSAYCVMGDGYAANVGFGARLFVQRSSVACNFQIVNLGTSTTGSDNYYWMISYGGNNYAAVDVLTSGSWVRSYYLNGAQPAKNDWKYHFSFESFLLVTPGDGQLGIRYVIRTRQDKNMCLQWKLSGGGGTYDSDVKNRPCDAANCAHMESTYSRDWVETGSIMYGCLFHLTTTDY
eukprot:g69426.t1